MEPEETEVITPEVIEEETPEVEPEVEAEAETEQEPEVEVDWKAKAQKAEEVANNQRIRAEKAEKANKKPAPSQDATALTLADQVAIVKANVHEDDIERVERYAKAEGMSVRDALKDPEMKAILDLRMEQRNIAGAANVSNTRRSAARITDTDLLKQAAAGKIPETDYDIARLIAAKAKQNK